MALSTTNIDVYRGTEGVSLPKQLSSQIMQNAVESSAIMRLANRIDLPGSGLTIPVITGDPRAAWVNETNEKAVSEPGLSSKNMTGYKIAVIVPFSNEFKRDMKSLYGAIVDRMPAAIAKKFDDTVFHGAAPGSNFDTLASAAKVGLDAANNGEWAALVAADTAIATAGGELDGWAMSPQGRAALIGAVDDNGRPLFVNSTAEGAVSYILGAGVERSRAAYKTGTPSNIVGYAGDWTKAWYGTVEDIKIKVAEEATINDGTNIINLWQRNMFAVMAEVEVGFVIQDDDFFVALTDGSESL